MDNAAEKSLKQEFFVTHDKYFINNKTKFFSLAANADALLIRSKTRIRGECPPPRAKIAARARGVSARAF
ncbi:MAG: hypothetical protein J1E80_01350 [Desulfovibrionaceae bacterium]|nr:hypothetical protein [Desulfovibrionaceae bacterium]